MAVALTWSIDKVLTSPSHNNLTNVVREVHWRCTGVDGEATHFSYGRVDYDIVDGDNFTPYEELTEEQVIDWVKASLGTEYVQFTEDLVTRLVSEIVTPLKKETDLPW